MKTKNNGDQGNTESHTWLINLQNVFIEKRHNILKHYPKESYKDPETGKMVVSEIDRNWLFNLVNEFSGYLSNDQDTKNVHETLQAIQTRLLELEPLVEEAKEKKRSSKNLKKELKSLKEDIMELKKYDPKEKIVLNGTLIDMNDIKSKDFDAFNSTARFIAGICLQNLKDLEPERGLHG